MKEKEQKRKKKARPFTSSGEKSRGGECNYKLATVTSHIYDPNIWNKYGA